MKLWELYHVVIGLHSCYQATTHDDIMRWNFYSCCTGESHTGKRAILCLSADFGGVNGNYIIRPLVAMQELSLIISLYSAEHSDK